MKNPARRIPIKAAREIANNYGQDQVLILAWNRTDGRTHVVTYGRTVDDCEQAAQGGNRMKKVMGWPESECRARPSRAREGFDPRPKIETSGGSEP